MAGLFMGVISYADDLIILAPSRKAAQKMLKVCEEFSVEFNFRFSTDKVPSKSKTKAMYIVGQSPASELPEPLSLCGQKLPWVDRALHLGHVLTTKGTMEQDGREKLAELIDCSVKTRETFSFAHPVEKITAIERYCSSAYGSSLWDMTGQAAQSYFSAWNTAMKLCWDVPRSCRTYLVQQVLAPGIVSMKTRIMLKFHRFFLSLLTSPSIEVQVAARVSSRDLRRTLGSNVSLLSSLTGLNSWTARREDIKERLINDEKAKVDREDVWRVDYLNKLLETRIQAHYDGYEDTKDNLTKLINSLVQN